MDTEQPLTPTRPYMVRAIYEWLEDNQLTPYMMVDATYQGTQVPMEYVQDGRIVLNVASRATGSLQIHNDFVHFHARFGGVSREIWVPMAAVMGIYAKENSQGMFFDPAEYEGIVMQETATSTDPLSSVRPKRENKAGLKVLD